jgi:hypothetical protein
MRGNSHVRFGERGGETRRPQGWKVRPAPTLRAAYLLTTLAFLHRQSIHEVIGSDINLQAVERARRNLDLLTLAGLDRRISQLKNLYGLYGKGSHRAALESAGRLRSQLAELPEVERIETNVFQADATNRQALSTGLSGSQVNIVLADVPYGLHSGWQGGPVESSDPVAAVLGSLPNVVAPTSLVALVANKQQKISHDEYERLERFQIGMRQVAILRPQF